MIESSQSPFEFDTGKVHILRALPESDEEEKYPHLLMLDGPLAGWSFELSYELVIGRSPDADVCLRHGDVSRQHGRIEVRGRRAVLSDSGSVNGTYVNGERIAGECCLEHGDSIQLGATTARFVYLNEVERRYHRKMREAAVRDPLTGALNRRYFMEALPREIAYHRRSGLPLSILILDVDHFKAVNDRYGHPFGDSILVRLTRASQESLRCEDVLCRLGGEEFAVLLRNTDSERATAIAERLRESVAQMTFGADEEPNECQRVTVSIGVGTALFGQLRAGSELVALADRALYAAKNDGRDCIRRLILDS